jgi:hypothetical protein
VKFSSRANRALLGVVALAMVPLLAPSAANAQIRNWTDGKHDEWQVQFTNSAKPTWSTAPHARNADIRHVMVRYAAKHLVIKEHFVDLKPTNKGMVLVGAVRTSTGVLGAWLIVATAQKPHGSALFASSSSGRAHCHVVHSVNYAKNRARISIPSSCLNNPRWVKLQLGSEVLTKFKATRRNFSAALTVDDARSRGHSITTWSPRIHHHHPHR